MVTCGCVIASNVSLVPTQVPTECTMQRPFENARGILLFTLAALGLVLLAYVLLGTAGVGGALVVVIIRIVYAIRVRRSSRS